MTVSAQYSPAVRLGNGATTSFAFSFLLDKAEDIGVDLVDADTLLGVTLSSSSYTVTLSESGGTVTYNPLGVPIPSGKALVIYRETELTQDISVSNQTEYDAGVVENVWDKSILIDQEQAAQITRVAKVPKGADFDVTLSLPKAGFVLVGRSDELGWESGPGADEIGNAQSYALAAAASAEDAAIAAELRVKSPEEFFASATVYTAGVRVHADTGEAWDIVAPGTGDFNHPVSGVGVTIVREAIMTLEGWSAKGDGVTDDTAAWNMFQTADGPKRVNPGQYLVDGALRRFDAGCFGNGDFDDATATWDQVTGDRERDSVLVHRRDINANATFISPAIKTQTHVDFTSEPSGSFKRVVGAYHEATYDGSYNTTSDTNQNFTVVGSSVFNRMAGLFGSLAFIGRAKTATEVEQPLIAGPMGAPKQGVMFAETRHNTKHENGGYSFNYEGYLINGADETPGVVPYENNDEYSFLPWTTNAKFTGGGNSPVSSAILMHGLGGTYGYWNGIVLGASMWHIDGDTQGPAGTVAINLASQRASVGFADIGIKFRTNNRHTYFREGHKSRSSHTRFMYEAGGCGVSIEGQTGQTQYLNFRNGADATAEGGTVTTTGQLLSTASQFTMSAAAGELIFSPVGVASFRMNSARLAPITDNVFALGNTSTRWTTVYAATGTINTSDARQKTDVAPITDEVLDAWGDVQFVTYRWLDAIAAKGDDAARIHYGVIAQQVRDAFLARGIDATRFGLLCYDAWGADGDTPKGDRWGIRTDQCHFLEAAYQRRRADRIELRLAALEEKLQKAKS